MMLGEESEKALEVWIRDGSWAVAEEVGHLGVDHLEEAFARQVLPRPLREGETFVWSPGMLRPTRVLVSEVDPCRADFGAGRDKRSLERSNRALKIVRHVRR